MAQAPQIEVSIYIGNRKYAIRVWPAIPRIGEEVMLRRLAPEDEHPSITERKALLTEHAIAIVESVCWGTSPWTELRVSLFCKWRD